MKKFTTRQLLEYIHYHSPSGTFELDIDIHKEFYESFLWHIANYQSDMKLVKDSNKESKEKKVKAGQRPCPSCGQRSDFLRVNHYCECMIPTISEAFQRKQARQMERGELAFAVPLNPDNGAHLMFAMQSYAARSDLMRKKISGVKKSSKKRLKKRYTR